MLRKSPAGLLLLGAILTSAFAAPLAAQSPLGGPRLADVIRPASAPFPASTQPDTARAKHPHSPSYWVEGGAMGAMFVGAAGVELANYLCEEGNCTPAVIETGLLGGALGFTAGALVGGAFPASHPRPLKGHPMKGLLVGTAAGALTTFGIFSQGCLAGCSNREVNANLLFTAANGLVGLLLGLGTPAPAPTPENP